MADKVAGSVIDRPERLEKQNQAPGPAGNLLLGNIGDYRKQGPLGFWLDTWREYGDITRVKLGPMVMHQIVQPE